MAPPRPLPESLLAALGAVGLAVGLTWPALLSPNTVLLGHPGNDTWNHAWGYWWVAEELAAGRWPLQTALLAFPRGGALYFIDTVQAVAVAPITWAVGPAAAFNVVMGLGLAVSAFGAYLLGRRVTGEVGAAAVAAVVYGASPHLLGQAYNGISETVCAGFFPLTLWALLRVLDRPSWGRGLALGLLAGVCGLTSWYYGLMTAIAGLTLLAHAALRQGASLAWKQSVAVLVGALVLAAAMVAPGLLAFRTSLDADNALVSRDPQFVWSSLLNHNITDAVAFFAPGDTLRPDLFALYGEELVIIIYLGWSALLAAGLALWLSRRRSENGPWVWVGAIFGLLSLGPYLYAGGRYLELGGQRIPLPFLLLFEGLPLFDRISHPFRLVTGLMLALALLSAAGVRHVLRSRPAPQRLILGLAAAGLVLVEVTQASPARTPVPSSEAAIPSIYAEMRDDPAPGAVLDLPLTVPNLERAVYVWYQTVHGRPLPWGLNDPMPELLLKNRLTTTLIRLEASRSWILPPRLPELDLVVAGRALSRQGFRYVIVHERLYPEFKRQAVRAVLDGVLGAPRVIADEGLAVYTLPDLSIGASP